MTKKTWIASGRRVIDTTNNKTVADLIDLSRPFDECHENAKLIAAAPEMLAELKLIQAELLENENADDALASRLYRVIAKATS